MNPGTYIGIDPGSKGGITIITINGGNHNIKIWPLEKMTNKDVANTLRRASLKTPMGHNLFAMIEHIHIFKKMQGASKLMKSFGMLLGYCVAHDIGYEEVTPIKWQKHYKIESLETDTHHRFKTRLRQKAEELFPTLAPIKLEVADSVLLAYYCLTKKTIL